MTNIICFLGIAGICLILLAIMPPISPVAAMFFILWMQGNRSCK